MTTLERLNEIKIIADTGSKSLETWYKAMTEEEVEKHGEALLEQIQTYQLLYELIVNELDERNL